MIIEKNSKINMTIQTRSKTNKNEKVNNEKLEENSNMNITIPENIIPNQIGLYIKKYKCKFGNFSVLSLNTYNKKVVHYFTRYSRFYGYSIKWKQNENFSYEITKIPMALLAQIIYAQNEENCNKMIGAWAISSSPMCSAYNVIASIIIEEGKQHKINKFSLYYPRAYNKDEIQEIDLLKGVSFRTAIFNAKDINEARYHLLSLYQFKFRGIIIDGSEDAIYPDKRVSKKKMIKYIDYFVNKMTNHKLLKEKLRKSYTNNNLTLLEDEWSLIKNSL